MKTFDKAEGGDDRRLPPRRQRQRGDDGRVRQRRPRRRPHEPLRHGQANDLDLLIHGDKGALKVWADSNGSTLEACLGPDIDTQTWVPYDCPPTPRNEERFVIALLSGESTASPTSGTRPRSSASSTSPSSPTPRGASLPVG